MIFFQTLCEKFLELIETNLLAKGITNPTLKSILKYQFIYAKTCKHYTCF